MDDEDDNISMFNNHQLDDDDDLICTPEELRAVATTAKNKMIPQKSKERYEQAYKRYRDWRESHQATRTSENVLLAYFEELSSIRAPNTLWSIWSMLKKMLKLRENVNIKRFSEVAGFVTANCKGYRPKKAKVFSDEELDDFVKNALNITYLIHKVVLVCGLNGAMRMGEVVQLEISDVKKVTDPRSGKLIYMVLIRAKTTKTNTERLFAVSSDASNDFFNLIDEYMNARSRTNNIATNRFILNYKDGKVLCQHLGINKLRAVPKTIANFLNLPNPGAYTGHSLRRTSASRLVNNGADLLMLKLHGGWMSNASAQGYLDDSTYPRRQIEMVLHPRTSRQQNDDSVSMNRMNQSLSIGYRRAPTIKTNEPCLDRNQHTSSTPEASPTSSFNDCTGELENIVILPESKIDSPRPTHSKSNELEIDGYIIEEFSQPFFASSSTLPPCDLPLSSSNNVSKRSTIRSKEVLRSNALEIDDNDLIEEFSQPLMPPSCHPSSNKIIEHSKEIDPVLKNCSFVNCTVTINITKK